MEKAKIFGYFKEFMREKFDSDAFVQNYNGFVMKYVSGHVYVVRTFFGLYKIKGRRFGLSFRLPFSTAKLVKTVETNGSVEFKDDVITTDSISVTAGDSISYLFQVVDHKQYYKKVFEQSDDLQKNINERIKEIMRVLVAGASLDQISSQVGYGLDKNGNHLFPEWIKSGSDQETKLKDLFLDIEEQYGIRINKILTVDFNKPKVITDAAAEAKAAEDKKKAAAAELEIQQNKYRAEEEHARKMADIETAQKKDVLIAEREKEEALFKARIEQLFTTARLNGYSDEKIQELLAYTLNPNVQHINMGGTSDLIAYKNQLTDLKKQLMDIASQVNQANAQQQVNAQQQSMFQQSMMQSLFNVPKAQPQSDSIQQKNFPVQSQSVSVQTQDVAVKTQSEPVQQTKGNFSFIIPDLHGYKFPTQSQPSSIHSDANNQLSILEDIGAGRNFNR